jgi:threonine aldolase
MTIDLRSDTVTKPSPAMREAMARAEVGDDVYGEDPTVRALEEKVATLVGMEAALFVPSGSMANQIALYVHTQPGDEVIVGDGAHCMLYESGAGGALAGVQFHVVGKGGLFSARDAEDAIQPDNHHFAPTSLVALENTHNRGGGRIFPEADVAAIQELARARHLALHLDGARIWNAAAARGVAPKAIAAGFDTVSVCLSKGLGAPVGSLICGTRAHVTRAHRRRKMLGGGMRQAGILAAAGLYALEHHQARVVDDHANAQAFAAALKSAPGVIIDGPVETNIVIFALDASAPLDADALVTRAKQKGVLLNAIAARRLRVVTHLDVDRRACEDAAARLVELMRGA